MMVPAEVAIYLRAIEQELPRKVAVERAKQAILPSPIVHSGSGRPELPDGTQTISISHSPHWLAIATGPSELPLGIDIEEKEAQAERLLPRYSTPREQVLLRQFGMQAIELWTAKEAVYKAYSQQITRGIYQVELVTPSLYRIADSNQLVRVKTLCLEDKGAYLSIATDAPFHFVEL